MFTRLPDLAAWQKLSVACCVLFHLQLGLFRQIFDLICNSQFVRQGITMDNGTILNNIMALERHD